MTQLGSSAGTAPSTMHRPHSNTLPVKPPLRACSRCASHSRAYCLLLPTLQPYCLVVLNLPLDPQRSKRWQQAQQQQQPTPVLQVDTLAGLWALRTYKTLARPYRKNVKHIILVGVR